MDAKEKLIDRLLLKLDEVDDEKKAMALVVAMTKILPREKLEPYLLKKFEPLFVVEGEPFDQSKHDELRAFVASLFDGNSIREMLTGRSSAEKAERAEILEVRSLLVKHLLPAHTLEYGDGQHAAKYPQAKDVTVISTDPIEANARCSHSNCRIMFQWLEGKWVLRDKLFSAD